MEPRPLLRVCLFVLCSTGAAYPVLTSCSESSAAAADSGARANQVSKPSAAATGLAKGGASGDVGAVVDAPIEGYRTELLRLAFDTASAFPSNPHVKTKARLHEETVAVSLELGQAKLARGWIEGIETWRRGSAWADLALYCAERGDAARAIEFAQYARKLAESLHEETSQDWHKDRILAKVAGARLLLGDDGEAQRVGSELEPSEQSRLLAVRARLSEPKDLDEHLAALDKARQSGNFDLIRAAQAAAIELYDRFYADRERRERIEEALKATFTDRIPMMARIEVVFDLTEVALEHGDPDEALALALEAQGAIEKTTWTPEFEVPLRAKVAGLRHRAGDAEGAAAQAKTAYELYEKGREQIGSGFRAGVLRPLAEAWLAMGDRAQALSMYRAVVEEGAVNINARPRAEDLATTCLSMARKGVEPDEDLWKRMREIRGGLAAPW